MRKNSGSWLLVLVLLVAVLVGVAAYLWLRASPREHLVVYTSQDQVYSEPILREFSAASGIEVRAVYDSEAVKTVGLANRLLAERNNPQCDVFWNNEELRTWQLAAQDVFEEQNGWVSVGFRSRRIVINTNKIAQSDAPARFEDLTNQVWRGKIALAYPLFGTTATHFLALRQVWGNERWETWCRALAANDPFLVDGNSVVVQLVGRGEAWIGCTDFDDIAAGQRQGLPVAALPISSDSLLVPNTIAIIRNAKRPQAARKLVDFLQSPDVVGRLVAANALEGRSPAEVEVRTLEPDWARLLQELEPATATLKQIFLR